MAASHWLQNQKNPLQLLFFHCRLSESRRYGRSRIAGSEDSHLHASGLTKTVLFGRRPLV